MVYPLLWVEREGSVPYYHPAAENINGFLVAGGRLLPTPSAD